MMMHGKHLTCCLIFTAHQLLMITVIGGLKQAHGALLASVVPAAQ